MSKIMFACDDCGVDHIIDSKTKNVELYDKQIHNYKYFQYVQYEDDPIPEEDVKAFDGFKWKCLKCGEEKTEEMYTNTTYHI